MIRHVRIIIKGANSAIEWVEIDRLVPFMIAPRKARLRKGVSGVAWRTETNLIHLFIPIEVGKVTRVRDLIRNIFKRLFNFFNQPGPHQLLIFVDLITMVKSGIRKNTLQMFLSDLRLCIIPRRA